MILKGGDAGDQDAVAFGEVNDPIFKGDDA
jgi:hypothetical protein